MSNCCCCRYKQQFTSECDDDSFLFSISLVPLRLLAKKCDEDVIVWQNPSTSSTRYCRPIKIMFKKESQQLVKQEIDKMQCEINSLVPYETEINGKKLECSSVLSLTMIDGKICSWLADTAGQCCHICGAKPKEMNNIAAMIQRPVHEDSLSFGISSLHAWIKILECILHIGYKLDVKKWQARGGDDKAKVAAKKKTIQEKFKKEMGLLIDLPKPGFGTTNEGNTARRVISNPKLTSEITGVDETLISKLNVILITLACGYEIGSKLFESYCTKTAELYVKTYSWYYMSQSLHKILIHGGKLINKVILPIGQMSEEAQEARNKDAKRFREFHSRKFSRMKTMEDMMHMLLITSDPLVTNYRNKSQKKRSKLPTEVLNMLKCPLVCHVNENEQENTIEFESLSDTDTDTDDSNTSSSDN